MADERRKQRGRVLVLRTAYVGLLILATLAPFQFRFDLQTALDRLSRAFHPAYSPVDVVDAVRNVALFGGWGASPRRPHGFAPCFGPHSFPVWP